MAFRRPGESQRAQTASAAPAGEREKSWNTSPRGWPEDLSTEGAELPRSTGQNGSILPSFRTSRSWVSSPNTSSNIPMLSDLVPNVVLMLPPCVCVGSNGNIDVHIEHPLPGDANYNIVCMMQGLHVTSTSIRPSDGLVIRVDIPPLAVGVVDVFVHQSTSSTISYAGGSGHLLILPDGPARDANTMLASLVDVALTDPAGAGLPYTIPEVPEGRIPHSRSCDSFGSGGVLSRIAGDHERWSEQNVVDPSLTWVGGTQYGPFTPPGIHMDLPRPLRTSTHISGPSRALDVQKWVWSEHFGPFILELESILHAVSGLSYGYNGLSSSPQLPMLELGPAFAQVLENMLLHLKKFGCWELIAFLLKKSIWAGVSVCWDGAQLESQYLTGQRLKELAKNPTSGRLSYLLSEAPVPTTSSPREFHVVPRRYSHVMPSSTILVEKEGTSNQRSHRFKAWISSHTSALVEKLQRAASRKDRKGPSRLRKLMANISMPIMRPRDSKDSPRALSDIPGLDNGPLGKMPDASWHIPATENRPPLSKEGKQRSSKWKILRHRFFKTDSANTEENGQNEARKLGRMRKFISSIRRSSIEGGRGRPTV